MKANRLAWLLLFLMLGVADELPAQQPVSPSGTNTFTPPPLSSIESKPTATDKFGGVLVAQPVVPDWASLKPVAQQTNSSRVVTNSVTIEELRAKAEKGDAEAQFELGTNFWTTDEDEAVKWFTKAAEQNYKRAFFYLGVHFGIEERPIYDAKKSFEFYLRGAKLGDAECAFFTGQAYILGIGTTTNTEEGLRWVRKSADQGSVFAPWTLADWYYEGKVFPKNLTNAIYWFEKATERGWHVQFQLGYIHETETKNYGEAIKWYRKSCRSW